MGSKTFFSFGGGVQSTAIALLLINKPEIFTDKGLSIPKTIIFADTGAEPQKVYDHVKKIGDMLSKADFNFQIVKNERAFTDVNSTQLVPWFTRSDNGVGMLRRQCTSEWKIKPIEKYMRQYLGKEKGQRIPAKTAKIWIGISCDESRRMRINQTQWIENVYPLISIGYNRVDCQVYNYQTLEELAPKSACYFCPYTHRQEWERRRIEEPELFQKAVEIDEQIRVLPNVGKTKFPCYIHSSGYPLKDATNEQLTIPLGVDYGFGKECEGHCGV